MPHYRRPLLEIVEFRRQIAEQLRIQHILLPITKKVSLTVMAHRHADGGDLANILQAAVQALDGGTLGKENAILADDSQIVRLHAQWL